MPMLYLYDVFIILDGSSLLGDYKPEWRGYKVFTHPGAITNQYRF